MIWETLGFLLTAIGTGIFILFKIKGDIFPYALKKWLNRLVLSNWQAGLPQKLPVYNFHAPKSIKDTGIFPQDLEYFVEKPQQILQPGDSDDLTLYGIDDSGNALVAKISKLWKGWSQVSLCLSINGKSYSVSYEGSASNPQEFSLGNFKLEMVEPFRIWRLWYNGWMEADQGQECRMKEDFVHVTLNFLWKPLDNPRDFQKNGNLHLLSDCTSQSGYFGENFADLKKILPSGYLQFGSLHGDIRIDDVEQPQLYLYGHRLRRYLNPIVPSPVPNSQNLSNQNHLELFGMCGINGNAFRLMSFNDDWVDGQALYASFLVAPISHVDLEARSCHKDLSIPKIFTISDSKSSQIVEVWPKREKLQCSNKSLEVILLRLIINGKPGRGLIIRKLDSISEKSVSLLENPEYFNLITKKSIIANCEDREDFVEFFSNSCQSIALVGGKGASLANLAKSSSGYKSKFKTAQGFCVTTVLFKRMLDLLKLKEIFSRDQCDLDLMCSEAIQLIKSSGVEKQLSDIIQPTMSKVFGPGSQGLRFAVRSSGVLEDGAELSCAGQNETFLGVDEKSIPSKIVDCWASLFTPQSVGYRLNHGQPAVSEMGVVVQEMVNASAAGVLFTANPRTGCPFEMVITANYGLGESVVSASCDPDTIILHRQRRDSTNLLHEESIQVGSKTLGDKKSRIVLASDGKSTEERVTNDKDAECFCLSDDKAVELGHIAVKIQKELGHLKPVDIEWAISEGDLYVLQSRAMTSLDAWTDFEIVHQFDTAIRTQVDLVTTANTGEVMPKPVFPISIQTLVNGINLGTEIGRSKRSGDPICPMMARCTPVYGQRLHLNMFHILYSMVDEKPTPQIGCIDLAVFGRIVLDNEMHQVALERHGLASGKMKILSMIEAFTAIWGSSNAIQEGNALLGDLELDYDSIKQSSKEVFDKITQDFLYFMTATQLHCSVSALSSTTLVFAFLAVTEGREVKDWTSSLYEDVGTLLSAHSTVESAEMPEDIDELGAAIIKFREDPQGFLNLKNTAETISWLRREKGLGDALDKFLRKHGHRAISEMDLGNKSWKTDPTPLINLLKNIVRNKLDPKSNESKITSKKESLTADKLLDSLKTPLKNGSRRFLKFLLPHCRKAVINRERSKSLLVRTIDQLKQGYYRLGDLMVKERLIPDINLLRHLTHTEMGLLINNDPSTPTILYKAMRRMKLYPSLEAMDYPEISTGIPKPVDNSLPVEVSDVIKATPVSSGKVQGIAKVCLSVEDAADLIRPGDILITRGTDIAWSPFFPIVGGVVTELGGLISHGAVVAREYGLPCIVGAVNATKIFKTGDLVILDTSTGTLAKVKVKISDNDDEHSLKS